MPASPSLLYVCVLSWGPIGWYTTHCTQPTCLTVGVLTQRLTRVITHVSITRRCLLSRIVPAEIFPLGVRGKAVSVSTTVNWLGSFAIGEIVPSMLSAMGVGGTFYVISACLCICVLFVLLIARETKGVTLERMETVFNVNTKDEMELYMKENWRRGLVMLNVRDEQPQSSGGR